MSLSPGTRSPLDPMPLSLYVHVPFCVRKCFYCDFNSGSVGEFKRRRHLKALESEIRNSPYRGAAVRTIFWGGGTPSELSLREIEVLVDALYDSFDLSPLEEWTIECNPGVLAQEALHAYRSFGFDRISLGVQSFHDHHLKALGRLHDASQARIAIRRIRRAGFENLNLDLIFALPSQTLREWRSDLRTVLYLSPEHISLYNLTVEPNTEFGRRKAHGELQEIDEDLAAEMFETAIDAAESAGYCHYEISNFARPGRWALHNLAYWRNQTSLGFGVSAASYVDGVRWTNCGDWDEYADADGQAPPAQREHLTPRRALGEEVMLRLRTSDGVETDALSAKFGIDFDRCFGPTVNYFLAEGYLQKEDDRLLLTRHGKLVADAICREFLA